MLRQLEADGIIDTEAVQLLMADKKARILKQYPPRQAADGSWYANIRFAPGPDGRKVIRKGSKEALEKAIVEFVGEHIPEEKSACVKCKYKDIFERWIQAQQYKNKNTEERNRREYRRFFEKLELGRKIAEMDVGEITASHIEKMMSTAIREYNLTIRKAVEDYRMFFELVYRQAIVDRVIKPDANPCSYIIENRFLQYGRSESDREEASRTIDTNTLHIIDEAIRKDHERKEDYMPPYACELALLTGMRVGELGGLTWDNIDMEKGIIYIEQSLKFDAETKGYYLSSTKNKKKRVFPITDDIRELLERISSVQGKYGKKDNYVFSNGKRVPTNKQLSDYLMNKKKQYGIEIPVSIHAARRTLNSTMAAQGVSVDLRASLLGHIPRVNEMNYTYDLVSLEEKTKVVAKAGKR